MKSANTIAGDRPALEVRRGECIALFAYDAGLSINLVEAERRSSLDTSRQLHEAVAQVDT